MLAYSGIVCTFLEHAFLQIDVRSMLIGVLRQYSLTTAKSYNKSMCLRGMNRFHMITLYIIIQLLLLVVADFW